MAKNQIAYVELPAGQIAAMRSFYSGLFGWEFQDWGPDSAAFQAGIDGGLNASDEGKTKAPLIIVATDEIEAMEARVTQAGGTILLPIFAYPGGRRFHFRDPAGNELAVMQSDS